MPTARQLAGVISCLLLCIGCSQQTEAQESGTLETGAEEHFEYILHDGLTPADVAHLDIALSESYDRVLSRLKIASLPPVTVQIWRDEEAYQAAMENTLGSRAQGSRGYVTGGDELRLLYHTMLSAQREAVHEFVHVVTLNINPDIGNNPRWLWEAVALYLSGDLVRPEESGAFDAGQCPSLDLLNSPFDQGGTIYAVGYLLVDFIETEWGLDAVLSLIKSNGDIQGTLGISDNDFEMQWCDFVAFNYPSVP